MRHAGPSLVPAALLLIFASGCVERWLQIRSRPPGAEVYIDGRRAGTTPLDHPFTFYGTVRVVLHREGYKSHRSVVELHAPWYQWFPLDIASEFLVPWTIEDRHRLVVDLVPVAEKIDERDWRDLSRRAEEARREALQAEPAPDGGERGGGTGHGGLEDSDGP